MGYAILRVKKLKSAVAVRGSMRHAFREQDTPNADPERTPDNTHLAASSVEDGMARFADLLPDKVRKNAVLGVEFLVTASPEDMAGKTRQQQDAYLLAALDWIKAKHGAENLVMATIHRDETTPHLTAIAVPIDSKGKLNCRAFYGERDALNRMQTEFAAQVGKRHGLERGIEGSKAQHMTVRQFYAGIEQTAPPPLNLRPDALEPKVVKKGLIRDEVETPDQVAARISGDLRKVVAPLVATAGTATSERRKRKEAEATVKAQAAKLDSVRPLLSALEGLPAADVAEVVKLAQEKRSVRERAAEAAKRLATIAREAKQATTSAVGRYCRHAWAAITDAGGDAGKVDWKATDGQWATLAAKGQDEPGRTALAASTIAQTVLTYSPQHAELGPKDRDAVLAQIRERERGQAPEAKPRRGPDHSR